VSTPVTPAKPATVSFAVEYGDMVPTIAFNLKAKGLIANQQSFVSRATERAVDTLFKEGTFTVPTDATLDQVIDALTK
jgi:cell division protein YceG involved in septum cleavage